MKVLLINPDSTLRQGSFQLKKFVTPVPPLGLAYLAATLQRDGFTVTILDQVANEMSNEELLAQAAAAAPGLIGISCLTPVMNSVQRLVQGLHARTPGTPIVLGNTHATIFHDALLEQGLADVVIPGEGEETMLALARAVRDGAPLEQVAGIHYMGGDGRPRATEPRPLMADLDSLPLPAWHLLDLGLYEKCPMLCLDDKPTLSIQASRGCFYRCTFCSQDQIYRKFRHREVGAVIDEMVHFYRRFNVTRFVFIDANFPFNRDYGLRFCDELRRRGLHRKLKWVTETRPDMVDPELLGEMKDAGLHLIMYGFEVGNQRILDSINKRFTLEQSRQAMLDTRAAGIYTLGLFMLGLPGETRETCLQTIRLAKELDCDMAKFNLAVPLPGSRFYEDHRHELTVDAPEKFTSWYDWSPFSGELLYVPEGMTDQELKNLQRRAMFEFYARPHLVARHLKNGTLSPGNMVRGTQVILNSMLKTALDTVGSGADR